MTAQSIATNFIPWKCSFIGYSYPQPLICKMQCTTTAGWTGTNDEDIKLQIHFLIKIRVYL